MNKGFWSHFKHLRRLLGKMYLFLIPSKTDGRVPSQQGAPTTCTATWLTGKFPSRRMSRHYWPVGVWSKGQNLDLQWGCLFPTNTFFPRTFFFRISQPAKISLKNRYFEEQIHWVALNIKSCKQELKTLTERFLYAVLSLLLQPLLKYLS